MHLNVLIFRNLTYHILSPPLLWMSICTYSPHWKTWLGKQMLGMMSLFSRLTSTNQRNITFITCIIKHFCIHFLLSGSVSVPSVTVVTVASWVRGICKYSASHLSLKHSSATRMEEARRAIAVMMIRPLSQKCLERPPQDREKKQSKSAHLIHKLFGSVGQQ